VVSRLGGRWSTELGIDLDRGGAETERWFLAATLFGCRVSTSVATRTFGALVAAGNSTVQDVEGWSWHHLVEVLDAGSYARYDYRMASRLHALAGAVRDRFGGQVDSLAGFAAPTEVEEALDELPGWGPVTVGLFLRELRGGVAGGRPGPDPRSDEAARHLMLPEAAGAVRDARWLDLVASAAGLDTLDLEAALIRLSIAHRSFRGCSGGQECWLLRGRRQVGSRRLPAGVA
jgi:hypothetical protein